jgi:tetratricopeptide (TPR) repeat protein
VSEPWRRRSTLLQSVALASSLLLILLAVGCGPSDPLERVRVLQDEKNDAPGSLEPLRKLIASRPDDPEVNYRYGRALIATGDTGLAVWSLEKAIESPDWLEKAGLALAAALISQGAYDEAAAVCTRVLEQKPDHVRALMLRATASMQSRRNYEQVLADAEHVLKRQPDNQEALGLRVVALLGLNRIEEGGAALEQYEALYRDQELALHGSPALCMARATFAKENADVAASQRAALEADKKAKAKAEQLAALEAKQNADLERAVKGFEGCLEQFPTEPLVVSGAIDFFDAIGSSERSESILRHMLEVQPEASSYRVALALRLAEAGHVDEAEAILRAGTEVGSPADAAEAWASVASFNVDHGDLDDAIEAFARVRQLVDITQNPQLLLANADVLVMAKRFDEAEKLVGQMKVPAHQSVVRGRIELERGNPGAALKLFDEGMRVWPNNAEARYYAAIAAEQLGNFARAVEEYRYAMRIDVTATDAYLRQARLQAAAGRYDAALETLEFEPGGRPEEVAAGLLEMRIRGRLGEERGAPPWVRTVLSRPERWGAAVAALGEGVRERSGPKAALEAMEAVKPLDLRNPVQVEALAAIVEDLAVIGKTKEGLALVDASLREHPEAAPFLALRGRALQLSGAPAAAVRGAFERALAVDAKNARALVGLARLEADAGSGEAALALYDRALAVDANDRTAARAAASLLVALGRSGEAEERLAVLLREHPYDADAARELAELRLGRGARDERTLELAKRAVTFGGGADAKALLERAEPPAERDKASATSG